MPPKKDAPAGDAPASEGVIAGFTSKETKLLAAAFVATSNGKIDYTIMAKLAGHTEGTLKKFYPPVKRKAEEQYPSFGGAADTTAKPTAAKPNAPKKRKTPEGDDTNEDGAAGENGKTTKGKGRGGKRAKKEKDSEDEDAVKAEEQDDIVV